MTPHAELRFAFGKGGLLPQEEMLEVGKKTKRFVIGIPKEDHRVENRISLTPEGVELLISHGHEVLVESNAGKMANYTDRDYSERGAMIVDGERSVFLADIVMKVTPPSLKQIDYLRGNQILISSMLLTNQSEEYFRQLMQKKITALAFENIKDEHNDYPIIRSMNAIAGSSALLVASELLSTAHGGKGVLLGGITGITPAEVVIIGAGRAAEFAARAAFGLGAFVKVFDNSIERLIDLQNSVGQRIYTSLYHPQVLEKALRSADVVIATQQTYDTGPRFYITEDMVCNMKKGTVIVDLSIAHGGYVETSELRTQENPHYVKHGVTHYSIPNIPSRVARTSSIALSNVFLPLLLKTAESGGFHQQLKSDYGLRHGVYMFNGILTNSFIGNYFNIPSKDIDLLMAAF
jgi:alanine dehydrogenase